MNNVWGYARRSTNLESQEETLTKQRRKISDVLPAIQERYNVEPRGIVEETASAIKVPFHRRPQFSNLLGQLNKGDWLVVTDLTRLDRGNFSLHTCCEALYNKGVKLYVIQSPDSPDRPIELMSTQFSVYLAGTAIANAYFRESIIAGVKAKQEHLMKYGMPHKRYPDIGFEWAIGPNGKNVWVADIPQRQTVVQIFMWHDYGGLNWQEIGRRLMDRHKKEPKDHRWSLPGGATSQRRPWVTKAVRSKKDLQKRKSKPKPMLSTRNVSLAYWHFVALVHDGYWWDMPIDRITDTAILGHVRHILDNVKPERPLKPGAYLYFRAP